MSPLFHIFHYVATSKTLYSCSSFQCNFFLFAGNKGDIANFFFCNFNLFAVVLSLANALRMSPLLHIFHYVATSKTLYLCESFQCNFFLFAVELSLANALGMSPLLDMFHFVATSKTLYICKECLPCFIYFIYSFQCNYFLLAVVLSFANALGMSPLLYIFHYAATSKTLYFCESFLMQFFSVCCCTFFGQRSENVSLASYISLCCNYQNTALLPVLSMQFFLFAENVSLASCISVSCNSTFPSPF